MKRLIVEGIYVHAGAQQPVFLCPDAKRTRVYVDMNALDSSALEFSYQSGSGQKHIPRAGWGWVRHEMSYVEGNFADELIGVSAVRLIVKRAAEPIYLRVEQLL